MVASVCTAQSITALAHLRAAVLYIVDISEQCGYTIAQQAALFQSIKPLFANKPLLVVANKVDVAKWEDLPPADRRVLEEMGAEAAKASSGGLPLVLVGKGVVPGTGCMRWTRRKSDAAVRFELSGPCCGGQAC